MSELDNQLSESFQEYECNGASIDDVKHFLEQGADPRAYDDSIFHRIVRLGDHDALELFMRYLGNNLPHNLELVSAAALFGQSNMVDLFWNLGANVEDLSYTSEYDKIMQVVKSRNSVNSESNETKASSAEE